MDVTQRLPDDVLADILRRLAPYDLDASRQVCSSWHAIVHDRHAHLLPLPLGGIFVDLNRSFPSKYFAPSASSSTSTSSGPVSRIAGDFGYLLEEDDVDGVWIQQHCNGLLLLEQWSYSRDDDMYTVVNPATRQRWAGQLPPSPGASRVEYVEYEQEDMHVVFDPAAVSPHHYEVLSIKSLPFMPTPDSNSVDPEICSIEWPPSPYLLCVFSSATSRWEDKEFIREGDAVGRLENMLWYNPNRHEGHQYGVYHLGALYVHQHYFLMRLNLANQRYRAIKLPEGEEVEQHIRKSEKGVYCVWSYYVGFRVWFLDESSSSPSSPSRMEWVLQHDIKFEPLLAKLPQSLSLSWSVHHGEDEIAKEVALVREFTEQDFERIRRCPPPISMLGLHPHNEEIVFFHIPPDRAVACHLSTSRVQDLGCLPIHPACRVVTSLPYTPC